MGDVVLQGFGEAERGFVLELVEGDVLREDVHEDTDVTPPTWRDRKLDEVAAHMFEDVFGVHRLQFRLRGWIGLGDDVAFAALTNEILGIAEDTRPNHMAKEDVSHALVPRVTRELATMCFLQHPASHCGWNDSLTYGQVSHCRECFSFENAIGDD